MMVSGLVNEFKNLTYNIPLVNYLYCQSVFAKSWTDVSDGLLKGTAVVHDGQRVGERVQGGEEEGEAHPSGKS